METEISQHKAYQGAQVLVTGATGFSGNVLTRKLIEAGANVRAIARHSSNRESFKDLAIEWHLGDVFDRKVVDKACEGVEYIFHLAAAFREEKATDEDYRKVHVYSTQYLAEAVTGKPEFKRFIHVSTVGVHGHIEVERADEEYRFSPGDGYQRTKLEGELWLAEYADKHSLPYTIIRPTPIFGPGDGRLLKFFRMVNKGYLPMLGGGKGIYHLIHVHDLTEIMLRAGYKDAALSEVLIAANDEPVSIENMGKIIAGALGKKLRIFRLPIWPFFLAADVCKAVCAPLGLQPPIYRRRVAFYTKDRQFDNSKVKQRLDYEFKYSNESGLRETADWYVQQGWL